MKSILILICTPILLQAQINQLGVKIVGNLKTHNVQGETSGIIWVNNLNWQQIRQKAKRENRYIFVDCYATWCGPCKKMDKEVYTNDSVGALLNAKFISVKIQMDSTKADNEFTQRWYKTAKEMEKEYRVSSFPTYLFFSPDGEIVYKEIGYKEPDKFILVAQNALNPSKQYFVLLKNYNKGKRDYSNLSYLITMTKQMGEKATYQKLLADYYSYLRSLKKEKLYTKENIEFIASTLEHSSQVLFNMFYPDGKEVNKVMQKNNYAKKIVDQIIRKEKVEPFLSTEGGSSEPEWSILYNYIAKGYTGDYADRNVLDAKMMWHGSHQNVLKAATFLNDKMEKYGTDTTDLTEDFIMNNQVALLWAKLEDTTQLNRMIRWVEGIVRRGEKATDYLTEYWPYYMDTYANLLYKIGRTPDAIKWQELAVIKGRERNINEEVLKFLEKNLNKMRKGQATWLPEKK